MCLRVYPPVFPRSSNEEAFTHPLRQLDLEATQYSEARFVIHVKKHPFEPFMRHYSFQTSSLNLTPPPDHSQCRRSLEKSPWLAVPPQASAQPSPGSCSLAAPPSS